MAPITTGAASRIPLAMAIPCPILPTVLIILLVQGWFPETVFLDVNAAPTIVSFLATRKV